MRTCTAVIERDPGHRRLLATCPSSPGAHSHADSLDELHANLPKVITMLLEDGEPPLEAELVGTQTILVA